MVTVLSAFPGLADTTNTDTYPTAAFTPVAGDLLVVLVGANGTVATTPTLVASANGLTFTRLSTQANKNTGLDTQYAFVANQLVPNTPSAMTLTFNCPQDPATGVIISGFTATGMSKTGSTAIRQSAADSGVLAGTAPAPVFGANALSTNPTLFTHFNTVGTSKNPPTGWTQREELFVATPTSGMLSASRDSGFTGTTITSGSTTQGGCSAIAIELDASSSVVNFNQTSARAGTGTLTAAGSVDTPSAANTVAGTGALSAAGAVGKTSSASLTGTGTRVTAGLVSKTAGASVAGTGTLSAAGFAPPAVNAGADRTALEPFSTVTSATGVVSGGTGPYTYQWTQVSGPTVSLSTPTTAATSFVVPPQRNPVAPVVLRLTVTDANARTGFDDVSFTALPWDRWYRSAGGWLARRPLRRRIGGEWVN